MDILAQESNVKTMRAISVIIIEKIPIANATPSNYILQTSYSNHQFVIPDAVKYWGLIKP